MIAPPALIPITTIAMYASNVAHVQLTISCDPDLTFPSGWEGYVDRMPDGGVIPVIHVRRSTCVAAEDSLHSRLHNPGGWFNLPDGGRVDNGPDAIALLAILHEAMHVSLQSSDEGQVECTAWQNRWAFVKQFGFPAWVAGIVMNGMTWYHLSMPANYRTVC